MKSFSFPCRVFEGLPDFVMRRILVFRNFLAALLVLGLPGGLVRAEESAIDFEALSPELPGWSATISGANGQREYRLAAKWDTPMVFGLESDRPHGGSTCLRCGVVEEIPGTLSIASPAMSCSGAVEIRFFVRSQGFSGEGMFSFDELDANGRRLGGKWAAAKIPLSDDWAEVLWTYTLSSETAGIRLRIVFKSIPAGAKVWIDDISVRPAGN